MHYILAYMMLDFSIYIKIVWSWSTGIRYTNCASFHSVRCACAQCEVQVKHSRRYRALKTTATQSRRQQCVEYDRTLATKEAQEKRKESNRINRKSMKQREGGTHTHSRQMYNKRKTHWQNCCRSILSDFVVVVVFLQYLCLRDRIFSSCSTVGR